MQLKSIRNLKFQQRQTTVSRK